MPGERYWLDVTGRDGRERILAAPRETRRGLEAWAHRLLRHVKSGDFVFHYDPLRRAIVSFSIAHGRVEKGDLSWPPRAELASPGRTIERLPSWAIRLRCFTALDARVPLHEIARVQWGLFPSLRALEDEMGDPLYYPFEMGNQQETRTLPGYVFKLPAILVQSCAGLANATMVESLEVAPLAAHEAKQNPRNPVHPLRQTAAR